MSRTLLKWIAQIVGFVIVLALLRSLDTFYFYNRALSACLRDDLPTTIGSYIRLQGPRTKEPKVDRWIHLLLSRNRYDLRQVEAALAPADKTDRAALAEYFQVSYLGNSPDARCKGLALAAVAGNPPRLDDPQSTECIESGDLAFLRGCASLAAFRSAHTRLESRLEQVEREQLEKHFRFRPAAHSQWFFDDFDVLLLPTGYGDFHSFNHLPYRVSNINTLTRDRDTSLYHSNGRPSTLTYVIRPSGRQRHLTVFYRAANSYRFDVLVRAGEYVLRRVDNTGRRVPEPSIDVVVPAGTIEVEFTFAGTAEKGWTEFFGWGYVLQ